jgi:hypothetical protein
MSPVAKPVSDHVMQSISDAIDALTSDPTLPRTKRELERLSRLSHATVARAFVQDAAAAASGVSRYRLTERFDRLTAATGRKSPDAVESDAINRQLRTKNAEIADLKATVAAYAQALYAFYLTSPAATVTQTGPNTIVPLGGNRPRTWRH